MKPSHHHLLLLLLLTLGALSATASNWPQFRGPNASGVADDARPPVQFGPGSNQLWKISVPHGISSPVVWGDHLFLTALENSKLVTLAYNVRDGRELWRQVAPTETLEHCHDFSSPAVSTPCTDGERVYVYFGSFGLLAYDFAGKEAWRRPLDRLPSQWGTATSPILAGGQLILQRDGDSTNSQLVALAPTTGRTLWESPRPLAGSCYSTPMVWRHEGVEELIIQGKGRVAAYSLKGGEPKWWVRGWGFSAVTTPVASDGLLFAGGSGMGDPSEPDDPLFDWSKLIADYDANKDGQIALDEMPKSVVWHIRKEVPIDVPGNGFPMHDLMAAFVDSDKNGIVTKAEWDASEAFAKDKFNADRFVAIRPGGSQDSTTTHVTWETTKGLSEMPSPLFYRGRLGFIRDGALWTVIDPANGHRLIDRERLGIGGQFSASPIAANGFIYVMNTWGAIAVVRAGDTLDVVATSKLGESVRCTPAIAGNRIFVRSIDHLWAFGQ
ncbi:MAG: PQQ-binding-like beta-propeller repeat protein [Verrucomicrobiales bacterium]|nr:PQQ-binding-like beta-propeller repeat protein [Verrucomicrobiales bacterium]